MSLIKAELAAGSGVIALRATADGKLQTDTSVTTDLEVALTYSEDSVAIWSNTAKDGTGTDYQPLLDSDGHLQVDLVSGGGTGGTAAADDSDFTAGSTQGTPAMGVYESSESSVTDGDMGIVGIDQNRRMKVSIEADNVGIGGGTQYTEDDAVPANPVGNALLVERDDALGGLTPAGGDWTQLFCDANGALWTHDDALDACISGSELQVDVVGSLPAGTNAIGKLAANSGVDIGDVDILSIAAGDNNIGNVDIVTHPSDTFAADAQAYGKGVLCQGDDGTDRRAILVGTDGHVQVDIVGALPAGTNAIGKLAANSGVDIGDVDVASCDGIAAEGAALGNGILIQGDDGTDRKNINVDATTGDLQVDVTNTVTVDCNSSNVTVDNASIAVTNSGLTELAAAINASSQMDVNIIADGLAGLEVIQDTAADFNCTEANSGDIKTAVELIDNYYPDVSHDAVDSGNPLKIGGRAQEPTAQPDEVANDDRVDALFDRAGRLGIYQGYPRWYAAINTASSGDNTIKAAAGAGKKILVTSLFLQSDGTVDARFESGASGTALTGQQPLQAREGWTENDPWGLFETAADTLLNLELSAAINVHGHIAGHIIDD